MSNENIYVFIGPNGQQFKCVESQLMKNPGKDPYGQPLNAKLAAKLGV